MIQLRSTALGRRIQAARLAAGMSMCEMARLLDTRHGNIGSWERGEFEPQLSSLRRIAALLGTTAGQLIDETDREEAESKTTHPTRTA